VRCLGFVEDGLTGVHHPIDRVQRLNLVLGKPLLEIRVGTTALHPRCNRQWLLSISDEVSTEIER